jgi:hypothetical protein
MIKVEKIDTTSKSQVERFVQYHYSLYKDCPQWVPPFRDDIKLMLNRNKHPYYERSDADFFIALKDGEIAARIAIMENRPFNEYHKVKKAQFYLFDANNDQEVVNALFEEVFKWCQARGLDEVVGPKGFSSFDGYGIQTEGFEHRQMMTMMNYNYPYYNDLVINLGFEREVDFISCYVPSPAIKLPEKAKAVARRVEEKGYFKVLKFKSKSELKKYSVQIGEAYNKTFVNNWEYYPLSRGEIKLLLDNLLVVADPKLVKVITFNDEIVGFLLGFPDVSAALQRHNGRVTPLAILDIMLELKRTKWVSFNGVGVLPEFHGRGGNALLYSEMEKTVTGDFRFDHAELTQVANTAVQMRKDLKTLGGQEYKNHRVYHRKVKLDS